MMLLRTVRSVGLSAHAAARRHASTKTHEVLCFPGDGVGRESVSAAKQVLAASGVKINWVDMEMGHEAKQRTGVYIGDAHMDAFDSIRVLFKGPLTVPPADSKTYVEVRGRRFTSGNQVLRKYFQLYANVRPARNHPGVASPCTRVDLVVVRENTEDVYTGEEQWVNEDTVHCVKRITRGASERIARFSIDYAQRHNRTRVTALHKANVCKQSDGLFLSSFRKVAGEMKPAGIVCDDQLADSCLTRLVLAPHEYQVLCCPNLYGDLVSDLAGGLIGSLGLCPSANIGDKHALFEPAHGSAIDIAGKGIVNPASQILSGVMMLAHLGEHEAAARIERALDQSFADGILGFDLGGKADTATITREIIKRLQ